MYSAAAVLYRCAFGRAPDGDALSLLRQPDGDDDGPRAQHFRALLAAALQRDAADRLRVGEVRDHPFLAVALRQLD